MHAGKLGLFIIHCFAKSSMRHDLHPHFSSCVHFNHWRIHAAQDSFVFRMLGEMQVYANYGVKPVVCVYDTATCQHPCN